MVFPQIRIWRPLERLFRPGANSIDVIVVVEQRQFGRADESVEAEPLVPVLRLEAGNADRAKVSHERAVAGGRVWIITLTQTGAGAPQPHRNRVGEICPAR